MKSTPWTPAEIKLLKKLREEGRNIQEIGLLLNRGYDAVETKSRRAGFTSATVETAKSPKLDPPKFGRLDLSVINSGSWVEVGLVGDTHLASKEERLSELHTQYDLFKAEGITTVFHAGNIVDGYVPRINGGSVFETSIDGQCKYVIDNYPQRDKITTYFITGDDHEGWWQKEGFNFGGYLTYLAGLEGRTDLKYIGHVEADVEMRVKGAKKSTIIKIQHPGGGSAYARSYAGQKQVEALEGGEKPDILVQGHYHVSNNMSERNVHVVSLPGFQDQTIFARKKRLRMEVGGAILGFKVNLDDGSVTRCRVEFNRYFTRGYYKKYLRSDAQVVKGHLVLNP
jgi:predicted phosphodiesterase